MHIYKSHMALLRITKGYYSENISPYLKDFIIGVCLEDRNVLARFDEIPSMTL